MSNIKTGYFKCLPKHEKRRTLQAPDGDSENTEYNRALCLYV